MATPTTITAASSPVYHSGLPFAHYWGCGEWIAWHKALKAAYGLNRANEIFGEAWNEQSIWAGPYNWCKYQGEFTEYLKANGFDRVGSVLSRTVVNTGQAVANLAEGVNATSQTLKIFLPIAVIGLGFWAYNEYIKTKRG